MADKLYDITALGELLIDFTPSGKNAQGIPQFAQNPGDAPANVLTMASRLGGSTALIAKVGHDSFGTYLRNVLDENHIDSTGVVTDPRVPTTLAFVHLNANGDRSFTFYRDPGADMMLAIDELDYSLIDNCRVFHFGSVSMTQDPSRSATFRAAEYAKERGRLISFDPNYRPLLWYSEQPAREQMLKAVALCDILKVSEEEMVLLTGESDLDKASRLLLEMGPALVLVSLGPKGSYHRNHVCTGQMPAYDVKTIDTTGAGDAFVGAVLWQLRNRSRREIELMSDKELWSVVDFANAAGSLTTIKSGAIPAIPTMEQIKACQNGKGA